MCYAKQGVVEPRMDTDKDFHTHWRTEIDWRYLVDMASYRDYIQELDDCIRRSPHDGKPTAFPSIMATAYLGGKWVHRFSGPQAIKMMSYALHVGPPSAREMARYERLEAEIEKRRRTAIDGAKLPKRNLDGRTRDDFLYDVEDDEGRYAEHIKIVVPATD